MAFRGLLLFLYHGTEVRVVFPSTEWFGTEFREATSVFDPSCFLFRGRVRNGIPRGYFYFLIHGTEFRVVFFSAEGFGTEFREFSVPRNSQNSVGNNHLFRLFRLPRNYFLSEIPYTYMSDVRTLFFDNSLIALHSFSFTHKIKDHSSLLSVRSIYQSDVPTAQL
jgi:hypothetical protein